MKRAEQSVKKSGKKYIVILSKSLDWHSFGLNEIEIFGKTNAMWQGSNFSFFSVEILSCVNTKLKNNDVIKKRLEKTHIQEMRKKSAKSPHYQKGY